MGTQVKASQIDDGAKYGIRGRVNNYSELPSASSVDNGDIYIVIGDDELGHEGGYYSSDGSATWTLLATFESGIDIDDLSFVSVDANLTANSDLLLPTQKAIKTYVDNKLAPNFIVDAQAGAFTLDPSSPPEEEIIEGDNADIVAYWFDDTATEYIWLQFKISEDINSSATVTFDIIGMPRLPTGNEGNEIRWNIEHRPIVDGEEWDGVYSSLGSGDYTIHYESGIDTQPIDEKTFTATLSSLGWQAGDLVLMRISRIPPEDSGNTNVDGDYGLLHFRIRIPRT